MSSHDTLNTFDTVKNSDSGNDASSTTRRVADAMHSAIDDTAEKAEDVEQRLRERATNVGDKVTASQQAANAQVKSSMDSVETFAKERPFATAGIAFAAGILATTLLRR